jgi:hypothetical protein
VSVPYPPNGPAKYSQEDEHLIELASRFILEHLDEEPEWGAAEEHLIARHGKTKVAANRAVLVAELDLEWHPTIQYDQTFFRRPGQPTDITPAPLPEVAEAIWRLGWPRPDGKSSRTIHNCFLELKGQYRHCDVYWAMHEVLKGSRLRCVRKWWMLLADVEKVLADPTLSASERDELERELEADLCNAYTDWLPHRVAREYPLDSRFAGIFDTERRLIIEAKISTDDIVVLGAVTQAMHYRMLANRNTDRIDRVAVLLPGPPSVLARATLRQNDLEVGFIWRKGGAFKEDLNGA